MIDLSNNLVVEGCNCPYCEGVRTMITDGLQILVRDNTFKADTHERLFTYRVEATLYQVLKNTKMVIQKND